MVFCNLYQDTETMNKNDDGSVSQRQNNLNSHDKQYTKKILDNSMVSKSLLYFIHFRKLKNVQQNGNLTMYFLDRKK